MSDYFICEGCEKTKLGDTKKYLYTYSLQIGQIIHIDGIPFEYLGFGVLGTNTSIDYILNKLDEKKEDGK